MLRGSNLGRQTAPLPPQAGVLEKLLGDLRAEFRWLKWQVGACVPLEPDPPTVC